MTGAQLRTWRRRHHLSQVALARALHVTPITIKRWEAGHTAPPEFIGLALERIEQLLRAGTLMPSRNVSDA